MQEDDKSATETSDNAETPKPDKPAPKNERLSEIEKEIKPFRRD